MHGPHHGICIIKYRLLMKRIFLNSSVIFINSNNFVPKIAEFFNFYIQNGEYLFSRAYQIYPFCLDDKERSINLFYFFKICIGVYILVPIRGLISSFKSKKKRLLFFALRRDAKIDDATMRTRNWKLFWLYLKCMSNIDKSFQFPIIPIGQVSVEINF